MTGPSDARVSAGFGRLLDTAMSGEHVVEAGPFLEQTSKTLVSQTEHILGDSERMANLGQEAEQVSSWNMLEERQTTKHRRSTPCQLEMVWQNAGERGGIQSAERFICQGI